MTAIIEQQVKPQIGAPQWMVVHRCPSSEAAHTLGNLQKRRPGAVLRVREVGE